MNYQLNISGDTQQQTNALKEVETVLAEIAKKHDCAIALNEQANSSTYGKDAISRLDTNKSSLKKDGGLLSFGGELEL